MKYRDFMKSLRKSVRFDVPDSLEPKREADGRNWERFFRRRILSYSMLSLIFLFVIGLSLFGFVSLTPTATVTLDINPSVTLDLNRFGYVLDARANNDDGGILLAGVSVRMQSLDRVVIELYNQSVALGYTESDQGYLLFGVSSTGLQSETTLSNDIQTSLQDESCSVMIFKTHTTTYDLLYSGYVVSESTTSSYQHSTDPTQSTTTITTTAVFSTTTASGDGTSSWTDSSDTSPINNDEFTLSIYSSMSPETFSSLAASLGITDAKLQLILTILHEDTDFQTDTGLTELAAMQLATLFSLYQDLNG